MSNVIPFDGLTEIKVKRNLSRTCAHRGEIEVDPDGRCCICENCGAYVDPFDVVLLMLRDQVRMERGIADRQAELRMLSDQRNELEAEVRRLKRQKRYWQQK